MNEQTHRNKSTPQTFWHLVELASRQDCSGRSSHLVVDELVDEENQPISLQFVCALKLRKKTTVRRRASARASGICTTGQVVSIDNCHIGLCLRFCGSGGDPVPALFTSTLPFHHQNTVIILRSVWLDLSACPFLQVDASARLTALG